MQLKPGTFSKITDRKCQYSLSGDGSLGLEQYSPYDGIIVTAAASEIPPVLLAQLKDGARLVIPVGGRFSQELRVITRVGDDYTSTIEEHVIFVPLLTGIE